jgi:hypothetical protein
MRASLLVDRQARPRHVPPDDRAAEAHRSGESCDEQRGKEKETSLQEFHY